MLEYAVLNRLADGEVVREAALRSATGASRTVLQAMLRKKWIARDDLSDVRDASRTVQIATLKEVDRQTQRQPAEDRGLPAHPGEPARTGRSGS